MSGSENTLFSTNYWLSIRGSVHNFRAIAPDLRVLATVDETTYAGGLNGPQHPFAWCHAYGGGRAFYTAGGHTNENYADSLFQRHLLGGLQYAMGQEKLVKQR